MGDQLGLSISGSAYGMVRVAEFTLRLGTLTYYDLWSFKYSDNEILF